MTASVNESDSYRRNTDRPALKSVFEVWVNENPLLSMSASSVSDATSCPALAWR
jgi:hypothetical protein